MKRELNLALFFFLFTTKDSELESPFLHNLGLDKCATFLQFMKALH